MSQSPPRSTFRPEFVRLSNRIAGKNRPLRFEWNGQPAQFSFTNLLTHPRGSWTLGLNLGGHALTMEISRLPELAWISPTLVGIDLQGLPSELACGLMEACFGDLFAALSKGGIDVSITSVQPFSHRHAPEEVIEWNINRGSEISWMHGSVHGDDAALAHLASLMERAPVTAQDDASLPVLVQLSAASMMLKLSELRSVEVHDVLFAELMDYRAAKECAFYLGGRRAGIGTLEAKVFSLKQLITAPAQTMANANSASVNDIEIELTFVVGQTTLTVAELRSLAPGFTFDLGSPAGADLTICANGKSIGKGQLIEVGEHLGVRVTEFSAP
ncbi:MAG: type III secretion system cytoplasmic ring protein SctQ [Verrucomicrobiota bacterium]